MKERIQTKVSILTYKTAGSVSVMDVYEIADSLNAEVTKRQAQSMIRKANKEYGY